ncbi:DUF615 domain-containing protein [Desulfovibrio litoralis]|uniref:Ribosome-associated protein n=1 Tax=Desulfovibrio litoralis DSM 11393 TaxID=1121455 RepID=A0A1M7SCH1_9BACT|nr:DUF615 domain-containing protein [Desulfovibrio litoralis]SHN56180.1 Protein of unknown function [Desulfovibrio litoralis DSM 11393]
MRKKPAPKLPKPEDEILEKSRSQKKRESTAIQELGERLVALTKTGQGRARLKELVALELLDLDVYNALLELGALKTHEAKRRHMQYIGKMMRLCDLDKMLQISELIAKD